MGETPTMLNSSPSKLSLWMEYSFADLITNRLQEAKIRNPQSAIRNQRPRNYSGNFSCLGSGRKKLKIRLPAKMRNATPAAA